MNLTGALKVEVYRVPKKHRRITDGHLRTGTVVCRPVRGSGVHGLIGAGHDVSEAILGLLRANRERGRRYSAFDVVFRGRGG